MIFKYFFKIICILFLVNLVSCTTTSTYKKTVNHIELKDYMGKWYVIATRPSFLEKNAYNTVEEYSWNTDIQRIEINLSFNKGSLDGPLKTFHQTASVHNIETNAHWKVSPIWPIQYGYLILAMDPQKQWAVVGVPNQKYIKIIGRSPKMSEQQLNAIKHYVVDLDYRVDNLKLVQHNP